MSKTNLIEELNNIKNVIIDNNKFEEAVVLLNDMNINGICESLIYNKKDNDVDNITIMELIINIAQDIYNNSGIESPIPDEIYDKLYTRYNNDTGLEIVGSSLVMGDGSKKHKYPELTGTIKKVYFISEDERGNDNRISYEYWIKSVENILGKNINPEIDMFIKYDGTSEIFECSGTRVDDVLNRGYTKEGTAQSVYRFFKDMDLDFTNILPDYISIITENIEYGVKTEVVISDHNYKEACKYYDFKSKRSCVSGILNSLEDPHNLKSLLTIVPLQVQVKDHEPVISSGIYDKYPYVPCRLKDFDQIRKGIEYLKKCAELMGIDADGVVIRINDETLQRKLGRDNSINKWECAYKFPAVEVKTTVKDVLFSMGVLGGITPVAKVEPVKACGNTIKSISLGSIERFEDLALAKGDEVKIKYSIVPWLYIDDECERSGEPVIATPTICPVCGRDLKYNPLLMCVNIDCPARQIGKIVNWLNKRNILDISEATVRLLTNAGYLKSISDLYKLKNHRHSISSLAGLGEASVNIIINSIESRKKMFDYELMGSIGIETIGERMFKKIMEYYSIHELLDLFADRKLYKLTKIKGIGENTIEKLENGIVTNMDLILELLTLLEVVRFEPSTATKVCFTKVRDGLFEEYLKNNGINVEDNYSKKLNYLIVQDYSVTSSKVEKAKKHGVKILSLDDAYREFGYK